MLKIFVFTLKNILVVFSKTVYLLSMIVLLQVLIKFMLIIH